jgi:small subunit ribosomal protein S12
MAFLTINQISLKKKSRRAKKHRFSRCPALVGCPQKLGIVVKVRLMKPKKPNSAQRKIARVCISSTARLINCYISGIGHNLREFSHVLVRGGRVKDLPGIQYHLIKGKLDFSWKEEFDRQHKYTKYGIPKDRSSF